MKIIPGHYDDEIVGFLSGMSVTISDNLGITGFPFKSGRGFVIFHARNKFRPFASSLRELCRNCELQIQEALVEDE